jgi:hypothetical protein
VEVQVPPSELLKLTNENIIQLQKLSEDRFLKIETFMGKLDKPKEIVQSIDTESIELLTSNLQISVSNFPNAKSFIVKLNNIGYDAEIYEAYRGVSIFSEHKAIWLGYRVGFIAAKKIILIAKESFPQIEYIELSNDFESSPPEYVHSQIYIGGSTIAAEEKGLKPFGSKDWEKLKATNDIESLHNLIKNHNA